MTVTEQKSNLIEVAITEHFGPRCETKDTDDMPWVAENDDWRCVCCVVWEQYDALVAKQDA